MLDVGAWDGFFSFEAECRSAARVLAGDASNWWGPNVAALNAMLREEGFARVDVVHREPRAYRQ